MVCRQRGMAHTELGRMHTRELEVAVRREAPWARLQARRGALGCGAREYDYRWTAHIVSRLLRNRSSCLGHEGHDADRDATHHALRSLLMPFIQSRRHGVEAD